MFHHVAKLSLALTLVAVLCLAGPAAAGPTIRAIGSADGQVLRVTNPTPGVTRLDFVATGRATLVGRYTQQGTTFVNAKGEVTGRYVCTTADGSTFSGSYTGTVTPIPNTNNNFRFVLDVLVERGTGRLAGLTGRFALVAIQQNGPTGPFRYEFNGDWILP